MVKILKLKGSITMIIENSTVVIIAISISISIFSLVIQTIYTNKKLTILTNEYINIKNNIYNNNYEKLNYFTKNKYLIFNASTSNISLKNLTQLPKNLHTHIGIYNQNKIVSIDGFIEINETIKNVKPGNIFFIFNRGDFDIFAINFIEKKLYVIDYGEHENFNLIPLNQICKNNTIPNLKIFPVAYDFNINTNLNINAILKNKQNFAKLTTTNPASGKIKYKLIGICKL